MLQASNFVALNVKVHLVVFWLLLRLQVMELGEHFLIDISPVFPGKKE